MEKPMFQASSLNLVAWFLTKGLEIKGKSKVEGIVYFYFERSDELKQALDDYNNNEELKAFISKYKLVRELVRQ